ncbi:MAG TPA: FkbM family methyltransferase [Thermoanaerobaculia bacterium]|nr:FkbM family methyltransferase [Thermoanaerobaculia bacterium]
MLVRILRGAFRWWPFMRGRGWILRLARLLLGSGNVRFDIGGGTFIEGSLDDWLIVWAFMRRHESDAPFQRSLDLIRSGDVVFDVGANVGIWSLLAAKRGARVHAFEPVPALVERLREHARGNGVDITINACAVGAQNGTLPFYEFREGNSGASSLAPRSERDVRIDVPVITLDSYPTREARLMKVDVEGAERMVFEGARALKVPIILFEIDEQLCARFGATPREIKQLLVDRGYTIQRHDGSPVSIDERHGHEDLFAMR